MRSSQENSNVRSGGYNSNFFLRIPVYRLENYCGLFHVWFRYIPYTVNSSSFLIHQLKLCSLVQQIVQLFPLKINKWKLIIHAIYSYTCEYHKPHFYWWIYSKYSYFLRHKFSYNQVFPLSNKPLQIVI